MIVLESKENEINNFIAQELKKLGFETIIQKFTFEDHEMSNVIAFILVTILCYIETNYQLTIRKTSGT